MANILVVDDDENMGSAFREFLMSEGYGSTIVSNAQDAVRNVVEAQPDMVFMDIRMPGVDGLEALRRIRQIDPNVLVIIMTAYSTSQTSIEAVGLGAFEYLTKPLDLDDVRDVIGKALEARRLASKLQKSADESERFPLVNLIGKSVQMQEAYKLIGRLTTNDVPALITGERGTGKQLVAQTIHCNSRRKERPFIVMNCNALDAAALEMEMFGREAAGPGALPVTGKIEAAHGGTLFIEPIEAMPLPLQIRLARFLRDKSFERAGGVHRISADTRILASSSDQVGETVRSGGFSPDLYDILRVISIHLPALRFRREDILDLVAHFIKRCNNELNKSIRGFDERVKQQLVEHPWNGNAGELERVVKHACILARSEVITVDDLGDSLQEFTPHPSQAMEQELHSLVRKTLYRRLVDQDKGAGVSVFYEIVTAVETTLVNEALTITNGNQVKAAEILGLNRTTLRKKISADE